MRRQVENNYRRCLFRDQNRHIGCIILEYIKDSFDILDIIFHIYTDDLKNVL